MFKSEENTFTLLSEAISEGVVIVDEDQCIVAANASASEMFEYDKSELIGQNLNILIPREYKGAHKAHVDEFVEKGEKRQMAHGRNLFGVKKGGAVFPVEAGLNPFVVRSKRYVMALVSDITLRKQHEERIQNLNQELEQKVRERTEKLNNTILDLQEEVLLRKEAEAKARESLQKERELNELKTKFLSLVSHEFKTPLSGILTSATLIGKYTKAEQQEKREKHLVTIKNKVKYLNNILNDFLSVERLETGKVTYKFSTFPLSKVVNEVVYDANMLLKDGQRINYPDGIDDCIIEFDEKILELILSNLINNAVKYSGENTVIDLSANIEDQILYFKVADQGRGIPEEEQKFIFNRYFRAENALLDQGTGIGLNIVKSHLENLGGHITFSSEQDKGSVFTVALPLTQN
ncbi:MAG: PAS domain-containing sensor histidine kinase [Aquimarina sp.]|nr:PAS domain-containing sensor histidine kinase [Aquimarina sp.]